MELKLIPIEKPENLNVILGQAHFIKTVEDLHEALVTAVPGIRFGLAFSEASGKRLVRRSGTDEALVELAVKNLLNLACGHVFLIVLGEGFYPINVLHAVKACPEVVRIYAATANPLKVVVAELRPSEFRPQSLRNSLPREVACFRLVMWSASIPSSTPWRPS